jgi:hypothetical protein
VFYPGKYNADGYLFSGSWPWASTLIRFWTYKVSTNQIIFHLIRCNKISAPEAASISNPPTTGAYSPGRTFGLPFQGFLITHTDTR